MPDEPFDPNNIPLGVMKPDSVRWINELVHRLTSRRRDSVIIQDPVSKFRIAGMVEAYCQTCLHRSVNLVIASSRLIHSGDGLGAMIIGRSLMETVAAFDWYKRNIVRLIETGNIDEVHDFVHAVGFATRLDHLIEKAGTAAVKATSILTQIDGLTKLRAEARKEYDHLCEVTHPNSYGIFLLFGNFDHKNDVVVMHAKDQYPDESFKWTLVAARYLEFFENALDEIDAKLPNLRELGVRYLKENLGNQG